MIDLFISIDNFYSSKKNLIAQNPQFLQAKCHLGLDKKSNLKAKCV